MKEHGFILAEVTSEENKSQRKNTNPKSNWKLLCFSWLLHYSPPPLKWLRNSDKHIQTHVFEKTEAYNRVYPGGTKQNWVRKLGNIWLTQANTIRQKMKFGLDYGHASLQQLSPTLASVLNALSNDTIMFHTLKRMCLVSSGLHTHSVLSSPTNKEEKPLITFFWA